MGITQEKHIQARLLRQKAAAASNTPAPLQVLKEKADKKDQELSPWDFFERESQERLAPSVRFCFFACCVLGISFGIARKETIHANLN